jgi:predicted secreted protein with PEFG-CTERM motif
MKSKITSSFFVVLTLIGIMAFAPSAFADTFTVVKGNMSNHACATTNSCFTPNPIQVLPGDTVTWTDTSIGSPHTVTSGKQNDNTTGSVFDSKYLSPGQTFSHTFTTADVGTIDYFDEIYPWMTGQVIVSAAGTTSGGTNESETGNNNTTIPEFGPIASLILVIAIVSVIAVTAKTRGFLKL